MTTSPKIYIASADYDDSLDAVVEEIFQAFPRQRRDKLVLVKPNILGPHHPERAVTTHPALVKSVVKALWKQGARVLVGDNPGMGGYGRVEKSARKSGILECAGECFTNLGHSPVRQEISSRLFTRATISRQILEVDEIVNLPKLKTHSLTVLTGAIKNTFGYVVGADKMQIHACCPSPTQFSRGLVDIYRVRPPELSIMDAILAMQGNGPSNGEPVYLGRILASDNAVSLDAAALHLLGENPTRILHLNEAARMGLGDLDPARMNVQGDLTPVKGFSFPGTFIPGLAGLVMNRYLSRWTNCLPQVIKERCVSCGVCTDHCPVGAMRMGPKGPELNQDHCISCYCCQEMCPENAIKLSSRVLRWLGRG